MLVIVRTDNIRHTHFSRNPKIAEYLKAYDYVKEFGEGVDRMCRELSAIGTKEPQYHLVAFIMKASVWRMLSVRTMPGSLPGVSNTRRLSNILICISVPLIL